MNLRGWDYTGRNIGPELHRQYRIMMECLSDSDFTNHSTWGNPIQDLLAQKMGMTSPGAVRTVKKIFSNFGFLIDDSFSSRNEIESNNLLSKRGKIVYEAAVLEYRIGNSTSLSDEKKDKAYKQIKVLYEEAYCDALKAYYFINGDGTYLHPLRATLRALSKYGRMDKWEWYLLNTCVRHDDNTDEEAALDEYIKQYRDGKLQFSMRNVVEKQKGHQYIPQYFEFAGLLHVIQRPEWSIGDSGEHTPVKEAVLSDDFLSSLYGGVENG